MKMFTHRKDAPVLVDLNVEELDGRRHYVTPNGVKLPSITTVLGYSKKDSIAAWQNRVGEAEANYIRNRAANRGTKFHAMMERYLLNEANVMQGVMPDMKQAFNDARRTLDRIDNILHIEAPLYSESLGVAGRTDAIAEYDGVPSIIDFKTSAKPKREDWIDNYFEQGAGYAFMYHELTGIRAEQIVIIISVDQESEPQVFIKKPEDYIESLRAKISHYKENNHVR